MSEYDYPRASYRGRHAAPQDENQPADDFYVYTEVPTSLPGNEAVPGAFTPRGYTQPMHHPVPVPALIQSFGRPVRSDTRKKVVAVLVAATILVAAGVISFLSVRSTIDAGGFHTAADIEPSLLAVTNEKLRKQEINEIVDSVTCVETSNEREWSCLVEMADASFTVTVNVAADYRTWVSHAAD